MRGDIAVIGDSDSVIGFKAVGFKTVSIKDSTELSAAVEKLVRENCCVVFITEHSLKGTESILDEYRDRSIPAIIPIPGRFGVTGAGMKNLGKNVERAIGTDILNLRQSN